MRCAARRGVMFWLGPRGELLGVLAVHRAQQLADGDALDELHGDGVGAGQPGIQQGSVVVDVVLQHQLAHLDHVLGLAPEVELPAGERDDLPDDARDAPVDERHVFQDPGVGAHVDEVGPELAAPCPGA